MKRIGKLCSFALALVLLLALLPGGVLAANSGTCGASLTWTLDSAGKLTISGTGAMNDFNGSEYPWEQDQIVKVVIGNGVTNIGRYAFYNCSNLTSVTIPASVTEIGDLAFYGCAKLTSVTIPAGVTSLGYGLFMNCSSLTALTVDSGNSKFSASSGILFSKDKTVLVLCPPGKSGAVTIPSTVTTIDNYAFSTCGKLTSVTIPASVTLISGHVVFELCSSLTSINVDSANTEYCSIGGVLLTKDKTMLLAYPEGKQGAYTVPSGVKNIVDNAFRDCNYLTSVTIPAGVESIGAFAFYDCRAMTSVTIPASLTSIGYGAFWECPSHLEYNVASANTAFSSIDGVLLSKDKKTLIACPEGKQGAYTIPSGVTGIADNGLYSCQRLTSVTIPAGVTSIGDCAFEACYELTSVTIPASVTNIGGNVFYNCSELTDVYYGGTSAQWTSLLSGISGSEWLTGANVHFAPKITKQPKNYVGAVGSTATATVTATGDSLSYQWYFANPGASEFTKSGSKTATYSATLTAANSGRRLYCVIKDAHGSTVTTNTVTMTVGTPIKITKQPKNYVGEAGSTATATVTATGDSLSYQWYFANPGASEFTKSGSKTATYSATLTAANSGRRLYCVIKDAHGSTVTTNTVTMTIGAPITIAAQPKNYMGAAGSTAVASVAATGDGLSYQWYFANPGASEFTKSGNKTANYSATLTTANSGRRLYCVIKDSHGGSVTTNIVTMKIGTAPIKIAEQPKSYVGAAGSTATATVAATGDGLSYQWYFANPGATSFTKSGSKTANYSAALTAANSGRRLYCVVKDTHGNSVMTKIVTMTTGTAPIKITAQPTNYVGAAGSTATATVAATGDGLTYQWYFANPGATSFTKSGSKTATYSATLTAANSGRRMYCVITDSKGNSIVTNIVTMKVG